MLVQMWKCSCCGNEREYGNTVPPETETCQHCSQGKVYPTPLLQCPKCQLTTIHIFKGMLTRVQTSRFPKAEVIHERES